MAYYTVAHLLQPGALDGSVSGPLGIEAPQMTDQCWDFVFKDGDYPNDSPIPIESLQKLRAEFKYWYPLDLRVSGRDLIRNHLVMCLYNHEALWQDEAMMPKAIYCNGFIVLNNEKMSKSTGNFLTMREAIELFGADATRLALADAGDGLDDANFDTAVANANILKLYTFEKWIRDQMNYIANSSGDQSSGESAHELWDDIFDNAINVSISEATRLYEEIKYKQAMKSVFFEMQGMKEDYLIAKPNGANPRLLARFIESQLIMLNPIIPHFA